MNIKRLKQDGAYSDSPYGNHIDGYRASDDLGRPDRNSGKAMFLKDAAAMLRQVGQFLAERGLDQKEISVNKSGIAGSGEVYGDFWSGKDPTKKISAEIGTICVAMLSGREDGVCIIARTKKVEGEGRKKREETGANQWLSPAYDSRELAGQLLDIFTRNYRDARICSKVDGAVFRPPMVVHDEEEGLAAMIAIRAAEETMRKTRFFRKRNQRRMDSWQ